MAKGKIVSAIEVGSSKTTAIIAQVGADDPSMDAVINVVGVSSLESRGIKKGQIVNIDEAVDVVTDVVESAERMAGFNLERAYVAVGGASISSQNSHGVVAISAGDGEIVPADVDRVIEGASAISLPTSREVVHVIPREFIVDGEGGVKDPVGMSGVRLETDTHMVTASTSSMKNLKKAVGEAGVEIDGLIFSGMAAAEAALTDTEKELGCVLVDIGGGTTSVAVYSDSALCYSGVIPVGAKNVTNDLAIGLRITLEAAEKLKLILSADEKKYKLKKTDSLSDQVDIGDVAGDEIKNVSRKTLIEGIIRPRLNEIFSMVKIELDKAGISSRVPSGVVITGGGAETVGVVDSAKRMMSLPARVGMPKQVGGLVDDIITPAFCVPLGLIYYGASRMPIVTSNNMFSGRFKLPSMTIGAKIFESIKNLLP